jgi:CRISPR type III-A-associated RAMP protein Csm4
MNPGLVVKLRPTGPWRIGPDSGARNRVDSIYHSDTLYAAVTSALARLGPPIATMDEWLAATARSSTPAVCFSSCFPFLDEIGFIIPPRTVWPPTSPALLSARVRWKSARFVPLGIVQAVLSGRTLADSDWSVDAASECLVPAGRPGPFRTGMRSNAAVDRLNGAAERHSTACIEFRAGAGLWALVSFADEAAAARWLEPVKTAFRLLADSGFGGERSRGWGRSEMPEFILGELPDMILPPIAAEPPVKERPAKEPPSADKPLPQEASVLASPDAGAVEIGALEATPGELRGSEPQAAAPPAKEPPVEPELTPSPDEPRLQEAAVLAPSDTVPLEVGALETDPAELPVPEPHLPPPDPEPLPEPAPPVPAPSPEPNPDVPLPPDPEPSPEPPPAAPEPVTPEPMPPGPAPEPVPAFSKAEPSRAPEAPRQEAVEGLRAHWLLSLFTPATTDLVDWARGSYTVVDRGGRIESPTRSGELKKLLPMIVEGSVLYASAAPCGSAPDVAPEGFEHPVYRAGFAVSIPLPEAR